MKRSALFAGHYTSFHLTGGMSRNFGPIYSYAFIPFPFQASKRDRKRRSNPTGRGRGGVRVPLGTLDAGVWLGSPNPDPISDQNMSVIFQYPFFRPGL